MEKYVLSARKSGSHFRALYIIKLTPSVDERGKIPKGDPLEKALDSASALGREK